METPTATVCLISETSVSHSCECFLCFMCIQCDVAYDLGLILCFINRLHGLPISVLFIIPCLTSHIPCLPHFRTSTLSFSLSLSLSLSLSFSLSWFFIPGTFPSPWTTLSLRVVWRFSHRFSKRSELSSMRTRTASCRPQTHAISRRWVARFGLHGSVLRRFQLRVLVFMFGSRCREYSFLFQSCLFFCLFFAILHWSSRSCAVLRVLPSIETRIGCVESGW